MKKFYITALLSLSFFALEAQQFTGNNNTTDPITRGGNLGLGNFTTSPSSNVFTSPWAKFHINKTQSSPDDILLSKGDLSSLWVINLNYSTNALDFRNASGFSSSSTPFSLYSNLVKSTVNLQVDTKVAIGTTSFVHPLQVGSFFQVNTAGKVLATGLEASSSTSDRFTIGAPVGTAGGPYIEMMKPTATTDKSGDVAILSRYNSTGGTGDIRFMTWDGAATNATYQGLMLIKANGAVSIGSENTPAKANASGGQYMLYVKGGILTQEVTTTLSYGNFPDYVFADDYKLMPLKEVESYIKENKHLPNVPAAKTVEENGLNHQEIILKQQEKIEELYLHLIELNKKVEELTQKLSDNSKSSDNE